MVKSLAINNSIGILICILSLIRLMSAYRQNKNILILHFAKFYLFLMLFLTFLLLAIPAMFFKDLLFSNLLYSLSRFFVFLSAGYFIRVPLQIWQKVWWENFLFKIAVFLAIVTPVISFSGSRFQGLVEVSNTQTIPPPEPMIFSIIISIPLTLMTLLGITFFFIQGFKSSDSVIKLKSFIIGGGMVCLFAASVINFMLNYLPLLRLTAYVLSSVVAWVGLLSILVGILIRKQISQETNI